MTGADFLAWRKRLGFTRAAAAKALGISPSRIQDFEAGQTRGKPPVPAPIPKAIEMACAYIESH